MIGINPDKHLEKARRIERSLGKLDSEKDWELIVEGVYGASMHYIACIAERQINEHLDTHKGLPHFLDEHDLVELASLFREVDLLRQARWYGGRGNGDTSAHAKDVLRRIKQVGGI